MSETQNGAVVMARDVTRRYGEGETAVDAFLGKLQLQFRLYMFCSPPQAGFRWRKARLDNGSSKASPVRLVRVC